MEIKWEKAYKVLSQSSLSICWNVNLKCINSHVMSLTLSSFSCLPSALKSQVIYNCSHYVKDIEVSKRCPGNKNCLSFVHFLWFFPSCLWKSLDLSETFPKKQRTIALWVAPFWENISRAKGNPLFILDQHSFLFLPFLFTYLILAVCCLLWKA